MASSSSPLRTRGSSSSLHHPPTAPPPPLLTTHTSSSTTTSPHLAHFPANAPSDPAVHPSLYQPRVAVILNVSPLWYPWLFALRLVSVLPALWWGLPSALQLLIRIVPGPDVLVVVGGSSAISIDADPRYALTETSLATIWCFASGYLSFFFTDCLMSRWLINYTPQATMVRLVTVNAINAYMTSNVLALNGGFQDPRLLLPGWIGIATTLTMLYHITHQKINIRKETSTSINIFSIASFISMLTLLAHMHLYTPDYPKLPLVGIGLRVWEEISRIVVQIRNRAERPEL